MADRGVVCSAASQRTVAFHCAWPRQSLSASLMSRNPSQVGLVGSAASAGSVRVQRPPPPCPVPAPPPSCHCYTRFPFYFYASAPTPLLSLFGHAAHDEIALNTMSQRDESRPGVVRVISLPRIRRGTSPLPPHRQWLATPTVPLSLRVSHAVLAAAGESETLKECRLALARGPLCTLGGRSCQTWHSDLGSSTVPRPFILNT